MTIEEREKQIREAIAEETRKRVEAHFSRPTFATLPYVAQVPDGLPLACTIDVLIRRHAQVEEDTQVALETLHHQLVKRIEELEGRLSKAEARAAKAAMP